MSIYIGFYLLLKILNISITLKIMMKKMVMNLREIKERTQNHLMKKKITIINHLMKKTIMVKNHLMKINNPMKEMMTTMQRFRRAPMKRWRTATSERFN